VARPTSTEYSPVRGRRPAFRIPQGLRLAAAAQALGEGGHQGGGLWARQCDTGYDARRKEFQAARYRAICYRLRWGVTVDRDGACL